MNQNHTNAAKIVACSLLLLMLGISVLGFQSVNNFPLRAQGPITPNDCAQWVNPRTLKDSGAACGGGGANGVTAAGTLASNNIVTGAGSKAVQDSGVAITSVATLTGTQSLTGKTLTGASNGNTVSLLNNQFDGTSHAGTGAAAALFTYTIPANTIGAGKGLRVNISWTHSTGSASVTYILKLGGLAGTNTCFFASASVLTSGLTCVIMNKPAATNAQYFQPIVGNTGTAVVAAGTNGTSTLDMTSNQDLVFSYNVAATDAVTGLGFNVEAIQ